MPRTPLEPALRASIPWLLAILLLAIAAQIALAGAGLLSYPEFLQRHRELAPWLTGLTVATLAVAVAARDRPVALGCAALLALDLAQGPLIRSLGVLRALHAIAALAAFAIALLLLRERLPLRRGAGR